mgnify:CR=1 FL=1|jgi:hypothetical protein
MYHAEYEEYDDMSREEWLEYRREKKQEKREADVEHQKKMIIQRLMGIGMLLLSVVIFIVASHAQVRGDLDGTPLMITVPMGLVLLFSKECCIV